MITLNRCNLFDPIRMPNAYGILTGSKPVKIPKSCKVGAAIFGSAAMLRFLCRYGIIPEYYRQYVFSVSMRFFAQRYPRRFLDMVRTRFQFPPMRHFRAEVNNHAHPRSADSRCNATTAIQQFCKLWNADRIAREDANSHDSNRFDVATSSRERKWKVDGNRLIYDMSDFTQDAKYGKPGKNDIVTMVDVDFHLEDWSEYAGRNIIIYTRIPERLFTRRDEGTILLGVEDDGRVTMTEEIDGGARWKSGLWDYGRDRVLIPHKRLGFYIYAVEKIPQPKCPGRYLVFLAPLTYVKIPLFVIQQFANFLNVSFNQIYPIISHAKNVWRDGNYILGRFKHGGLDVIDLIHKDVQSDVVDCVIPTAAFKMLFGEIARDRKCATVAHVENRLRNEVRRSLPSTVAFRWCDFLQQGTDYLGPPLCRMEKCMDKIFERERDGSPSVGKDGCQPRPSSIPPPYEIDTRINYVWAKHDNHDEGKMIATLQTPPLTDPVVAPTECPANDAACVKQRIEDVRNRVEFTPQVHSIATEYAKLISQFVTTGYSVTPWSIEDVIASQKRPTQRLRNALFVWRGFGDPARLKSFQKQEVYEDPKAPRNISTVQTSDTIRLGQYMLPLKERMVTVLPWFMPGKNPEQITDAIHAYCKRRTKVVETDYSKWDGTLSRDMRQLEQKIILDCFHQDYHDELRELLDRDTQLTGYTKFGIPYCAEYSRMSGSQSTTLGNSILNGFVAYLAYRLAGKNSLDAWRCIGPKFGDDGVDDVGGKWLAAAKMLGLKLKMDIRYTRRFVTFCGRYYIQPALFKCSIFNPRKLVRSLPVSLSSKEYISKLQGYAITERHVPITGAYIRALLRVKNVENPDNIKLVDPTYGFEITPFPYDVNALKQIHNVLCTALGAKLEDLFKLEDALDRVTTVDDLAQISGTKFIRLKREIPSGVRFVEGIDGTIRDKNRGQEVPAPRKRGRPLRPPIKRTNPQ